MGPGSVMVTGELGHDAALVGELCRRQRAVVTVESQARRHRQPEENKERGDNPAGHSQAGVPLADIVKERSHDKVGPVRNRSGHVGPGSISMPLVASRLREED